jgi:hypothetical protein
MLCGLGQKAHVTETTVLMLSHDDVVHHRYAEELTGCYELPRGTDVFVARHCYSGRMVMRHDNSCRMVSYGHSEYLSGVRKYAVYRADKYRMTGNDLLTVADTQAQKVFLLLESNMLEFCEHRSFRVCRRHAY